MQPLQGLQTRLADWKQSTKAFRRMRVDSSARDHATATVQAAAPRGAGTIELEPLDEIIPETLKRGEPMLKVTPKKAAQRVFAVDTDQAFIAWASKRNNIVPLYAIRDVRIGANARTYRQALHIADEHEPRWISVIYQTPKAYKAVHMVALSAESMQRWCDALLRVLAQRLALLTGRAHPSSTQYHWLNASWRDTDTALDLGGVQRLCRRTGIQCGMRELRAHFDAADTEHCGVLHFASFQRFVAALKRRTDIEQIFERVAGGASVLSSDAFSRFIAEEQGEDWGADEQARVYARYSTNGDMRLDGFHAFLLSTDNLAESSPSGPLQHPLTDYFISSSHNTYLVGGQWKGDSTVEGYVRALQQGAKSVELDCWDGPNGQPQVTHGRTLTSRVPFDDVVAAVAQYAFVASPYPLILSLEVHNDVAQQERIAHILTERLGHMLVTSRVAEEADDCLPSPEQLRHKVLVKCKHWPLIHTLEQRGEFGDDMSLSTTDHTESEGDSFLDQARGLVRQMRRPLLKEPRDFPVMSDKLVHLLVYTVGVRFRGINKKEHYAPEHIFSLSEYKALRIIRQGNADLVKHNVVHLTRVYPSLNSLSRLNNSANFLPHTMWAAGCQLVALNWQTRDRGMEMNHAFFAGGAGYRLKPPGLRVRSTLKSTGQAVRITIALTLISAQQLPSGRDDNIAPYVTFSVDAPVQWGKHTQVQVGHEDEHVRSPGALPRTAAASGGLMPSWNTQCTLHIDVPATQGTEKILEHRGTIPQVTHGLLDLCFLRFQVMDEQPGMPVALGSSMVNLGQLRSGYRHIPLYDTQLSRLLYSSLFMHIQYTHVELVNGRF
ncbi:phosphoinositide phospholipase C [Malassezia vespertilionis]|uniref:phosphoinositide phospholipase C n=1 Tax=Malassezia vespertilionis TaxID=2020962 RepID=UPI0024B25994|nr:phosphoinositide phospholipase C [Malassezia vespertilionis]WFD06312.1 phosphoinositide phospholipase C [Malassezia vespertilionis]